MSSPSQYAHEGVVVRSPDSNSSLHNYLYYSTLLGVFSSVLRIHVPFAIRLFDVLMLTNLLLMFLTRIISFARISAWILWLILYLAVSGGIGVVTGTDTIPLVSKEFLGISVSLLYFYSFFKLVHNDFERAFSTYAKVAYWFALVALPLWVVSCIQASGYTRLCGFTAEPTSFCQLVLPAFYWYTYQYFTSGKHSGKVLIFGLTIVLSGSSNGYICVAFGTVLLLSGRRRHFVAIPIVLGGLLALTYAISSDFRMRIDDTLLSASTGDVNGVNWSTYALISNAFVTQQVLKESPIIGNGLGSHPVSHARFIGNLPGVDNFIKVGGGDLNAPDAASLTLRAISELGLLGYLSILAFLFRFHVGGSGQHAAISNALLVCFFLKLLRGGNYFEPEQFFFVFIYIFNYRRFKREARAHIRRGSEMLPMAGLGMLES